MYVPAAFAEPRLDVARRLIAAHPLGHLVTVTDDGIEANPVPMLLEGDSDDLRLVGHLARANPQWSRSQLEVEGLAIFTGPGSYVSPSWYPSKQVDGKVVPTWNYEVIQVRGTLRVHHDDDWKLALVTRLTERMESGAVDPWAVTDAPREYIAAMLRAIVGIELLVTSLQVKRKLSQNRAEEDAAAVVRALRSSGSAADAALADAMEER